MDCWWLRCSGDLYDDVDIKAEPSDDDSPVRCEWSECNQDFLGSRALAEHVRKAHCRAEGNDEYICKWATCKRQQKPFPIPQQFLRHMQTHTREKPYQCKHPGCGQTFTQANVLAAHTRTHTGEKPYQCNVAGCGKKFAYANCLLAHTRSHTGMLGC
jgi:zinc finger protein GLIS1/3